MQSFSCLLAMESGHGTVPTLMCDNMHSVLPIREAHLRLVSRGSGGGLIM